MGFNQPYPDRRGAQDLLLLCDQLYSPLILTPGLHVFLVSSCLDLTSGPQANRSLSLLTSSALFLLCSSGPLCHFQGAMGP